MSVTRWAAFASLTVVRRQPPSSGVRKTLAVLRDRYTRTDDKTARDLGPDGNQLGNHPENHAADLREDTHPVSDLLPSHKS